SFAPPFPGRRDAASAVMEPDDPSCFFDLSMWSGATRTSTAVKTGCSGAFVRFTLRASASIARTRPQTIINTVKARCLISTLPHTGGAHPCQEAVPSVVGVYWGPAHKITGNRDPAQIT